MWLLKKKGGRFVLFVINIPPTTKLILGRGHGLKSHPTDCRSQGSNPHSLVYKVSGLSATPQQFLKGDSNSTSTCIMLTLKMANVDPHCLGEKYTDMTKILLTGKQTGKVHRYQLSYGFLCRC